MLKPTLNFLFERSLTKQISLKGNRNSLIFSCKYISNWTQIVLKSWFGRSKIFSDSNIERRERRVIAKELWKIYGFQIMYMLSKRIIFNFSRKMQKYIQPEIRIHKILSPLGCGYLRIQLSSRIFALKTFALLKWKIPLLLSTNGISPAIVILWIWRFWS